MPRGEKTGKMTKEQLEKFRGEMFQKSLKELEKEYPVSASQLCRIRSGQNWGKHGIQ